MKAKDLRVGMRVFVGRSYGEEAFILSDQANWEEGRRWGSQGPGITQYDNARGVAIAKRGFSPGVGDRPSVWVPGVTTLGLVKPWEEHEAEVEAERQARMKSEEFKRNREAERQATEDRLNARIRKLAGGEPGTTYCWIEDRSGRVKMSVEALDNLLDCAEDFQP